MSSRSGSCFEKAKYIYQRYFELKKEGLCDKDIFKRLASEPAPQYFVGYELARRHIATLRQGKTPKDMKERGLRLAKYMEIYEKAEPLFKEHPWAKPIDILPGIITSTASSLFMDSASIRNLFYSHIRNRHEKVRNT